MKSTRPCLEFWIAIYDTGDHSYPVSSAKWSEFHLMSRGVRINSATCDQSQHNDGNSSHVTEENYKVEEILPYQGLC